MLFSYKKKTMDTVLLGVGVLIFGIGLPAIKRFFVPVYPTEDAVKRFNEIIESGEYQDVSLIPIPLIRNGPTSLANPKNQNCGHGFYKCVGKCDCLKSCGVDFEPISVQENESVIVNNVKLSVGDYCVRHLFPHQCLRFASHIVLGEDKWSCLCKFPEFFAGPECNKFVGCMGQNNVQAPLWDRKTNNRVVFGSETNLYETVSEEDVTPRYYCNCGNVVDENGNKMIGNDLLPFLCLKDGCLNNLPFSSVPGIDWSRGCDCGDFSVTRQKNLIENDRKTPCTSCFNGYDEKKRILQLYVGCFTPTSPAKDGRELLPCLNDVSPTKCGKFTIRINNGPGFKESSYKEWKNW